MPCLPGPLHVLCGQRRLSLTPGVLGVRGVQWAFQVLSQSLRTRRSRDPSAAGSQRGTGRDCRHQGQSWSVLVALPDPARRQRAAALPPAAGGMDEALGAEGQGCTGTPPTQQCSLHLRPGRGRVQGRPLPAPRTPSLGTQAQGEWGSGALLEPQSAGIRLHLPAHAALPGSCQGGLVSAAVRNSGPGPSCARPAESSPALGLWSPAVPPLSCGGPL